MIRRAALLLSALVATDGMAAGGQFENVDRSFIGVVDLQARYGGYDKWVRAAWDGEDPKLTFELSEGRPFESTPTRLNATQFSTLET